MLPLTPSLSPSEGQRVPERRVRGAPLDPAGEPWTAARLLQAVEAFYVEHQRICLDPNARNVRHTYVLPSEDKRSWRIQQVLVDPEEHNDWIAEFEVDLAKSRTAGEPALRLHRIGSIA